jgi:DNA invertase Pin-like site-specific DNA recombinase
MGLIYDNPDLTPPREVAKNLGVSVPTLYRWVPATDAAEVSTP